MGQRGPKPTPTVVLEARGTAGRHDRTGEPRPPIAAPSCPTWLSVEAKAEWKRATKYLLAMGCVAECDRAMLAAYCEAWSDYFGLVKEVKQTVAKQGMAAAIGAGLVGARDKAADRMARLAAQFGFSPSSRVRVKVDPEQQGQGDGEGPKLYKIRS